MRHLIHRLLFWLLLKVVRHAADVRVFAKLIAHSRIRHRFNLPLFGEDLKLDKKLENIVDRFFEPEIEKGGTPFENQDTEILQWLESDTVSRNDRKMHFRVSHWLAIKTGNKDEACALASTYKDIHQESIEPINSAEIKKAYSKFRKRFRAEQHAFRDSKAMLISFSLKDLIQYLPYISVLIIIGGYVHVTTVYSHFGIDTTQFFSLDDYLAASIEEIKYSLWLVFAYLFGMLHAHRNLRTRTQSEYELRENRWSRRLFVWVVRLYFAIFLYMTYKGLLPSNLVYVGSLIFTVYFAPDLIFYVTRKYFENAFFVGTVILSLILFFSSLYFDATRQIKKVEEGNSGQGFEIKAGTRMFTHEDFLFIGGNKRYIFLRAQDGSIEIIPNVKAERIVISIPDEVPNSKESQDK